MTALALTRLRRLAASTLIEITIAVAIFAVVITAIMDVFVSARGLDDTHAAHDDLTLAADRIFSEMAKDLSDSGWLIPGRNPLPTDIAPPGPLPLPNDNASDRATRYFPFIQHQNAVGAAFGYTRHSGWDLDMTRLFKEAPNLPGAPADATTTFGVAGGAAYRASFYAASQEMIFVKLITEGGWQADPLGAAPPTIDFTGSIAEWQDPNRHWTGGPANGHQPLYPSPWIEQRDSSGNITNYVPRPECDGHAPPGATPLLNGPYGVPLKCARIDNNSSDPSLERIWETMTAPSYDTTKGPFRDDDNVRDYEYAVVRSPIGLGRLVRAFKEPVASTTRTPGVEVGQEISSDGTYRIVVQKVLSDDVVRIVCDTCRSEGAGAGPVLDVDDVRVRLYLAKRGGGHAREGVATSVVLYRVAETVFALRAKATESDRKGDATYVTPKPPGSVFLPF